MFTQCSKCETVFRLSADALRAAGGQVRCGRCGEVFNALSRLAEEAGAFTTGESPLFLETRADEILESSSSDLSHPPADHESAPALDPARARGIELPPGHANDIPPDHATDLPPGVEGAHLQFIGPVDDELAAETSLEFTLPPGELDRIFIETPPTPLQQLTTDAARAERAERPSEHPAERPLDRPTEHTDERTAEDPAHPTPAHPESSTEVSAESAPRAPARTATIVQMPQAPARPAFDASASRVAELIVSEEVRQDVLSSVRADPRNPRPRAPPRSAAQSPLAQMPFFGWLSAAILLSVVLVLQVVRGNSGWLAVHMPLLAGSGPTAASLSVYQLRQWGVTGDPGAKGTLRVRASIMNTAPRLQRYPLLRVSLVNRFGTRVGAREFEPAEYMGHGVTRQLAPGERVDATLDIVDPGKDAEGFEIDVCLRDEDKRIICAGDAAAQAR